MGRAKLLLLCASSYGQDSNVPGIQGIHDLEKKSRSSFHNVRGAFSGYLAGALVCGNWFSN